MSRTWRASWGASACLPCKNNPKWCKSARAASLITTLNSLSLLYQERKHDAYQIYKQRSPCIRVTSYQRKGINQKTFKKKKPRAAGSIIFINKSDFELFQDKREGACSIQALSSIISREPLTKMRFLVQFHQLFHHCTVNTP